MAKLLDILQKDVASSLKRGDAVRVETIRFLLAAVRNAAIDTYQAQWETSLTDADILAVVKKQVKTHRESVEAFTKANRPDLVAKEQAQLAVLAAMLPPELSDDELRAILAPVVTSGEPNFGKLMGQAMAAVAGRADGSRVSLLLKQLLGEKK